MERLAEVGFRLQRAAAPLCREQASGTGIVLDFIGAYQEKDRPAVSALLGMSQLPQIAAVVEGSPGEKAGLMPGDDVVAVNGKPVLELLAEQKDAALFADFLAGYLADQARDTPIMLQISRDGRRSMVAVVTVPVCRANVVIKTDSGVSAYTDGKGVAVSSGLIEFTRNDDELALVVGHELGHLVVEDGDARSLSERRWMEDRADILGVRLSHCAGYDLEQGLQYWLRRDAGDWLRWFRDPTHRSRKSRVRRMRAEGSHLLCPPSAQVSRVGRAN